MSHSVYRKLVVTVFLSTVLLQTQALALDPVDISTFGPTTTFNGSNNVQPGGDMEANRFQILTGNPAPIRRLDLLFDMNTTEAGLQGLVVSIWSDSGTTDSHPQAQLGTTFDYLPNTSFNDGVHRFASFYSTPIPQTSTFTFPGSGLYWIVVGPASEKVTWAKTTSTTTIYNSLVPPTAAVDPFQLQFNSSANKWQSPGGGQGNQIMAFSLVHAPEPSTYLLGLIVAGALVLTMRFKGYRKESGPIAMQSQIQA